jgi:hypothetical protein
MYSAVGINTKYSITLCINCSREYFIGFSFMIDVITLNRKFHHFMEFYDYCLYLILAILPI